MERKFINGQKATFLRDIVLSADDGMLTTLAVISGSIGASFSSNVAIALGLANVLADGVIMATSVYMGIKSELEMDKGSAIRISEGSPIMHGLVTYISFTGFGIIPLLPYFFNFDHKFVISLTTVMISMFLVGVFKAVYTHRNFIRGGLEMLLIGSLSAGVAYGVGFLADLWLF